MDRSSLATLISETVATQRTAADTVAARVSMACSPAWYGKQRPDHYRTVTSEALDALKAISRVIDETSDLLEFYRLLYPAAHDDDLGAPGMCKCGRWAETCPARAAAAAGEINWTDEDGTEHDIGQTGHETPTPPAPEPAEDPAEDQVIILP